MQEHLRGPFSQSLFETFGSTAREVRVVRSFLLEKTMFLDRRTDMSRDHGSSDR